MIIGYIYRIFFKHHLLPGDWEAEEPSFKRMAERMGSGPEVAVDQKIETRPLARYSTSKQIFIAKKKGNQFNFPGLGRSMGNKRSILCNMAISRDWLALAITALAILLLGQFMGNNNATSISLPFQT